MCDPHSSAHSFATRIARKGIQKEVVTGRLEPATSIEEAKDNCRLGEHLKFQSRELNSEPKVSIARIEPPRHTAIYTQNVPTSGI